MALRPLSVLALALVGALSLSACSSDSTDGSDTPEVAASVEPSEPSAEPSAEASAQPDPDPTTEEPVEEKPLTYEDLVTGNLSNAEICASYQTLIDKYDAVITKRTKSLDGKSEDPYKAASFKRKNDWVSSNLSSAYEEDWEATATSALNVVSNGQAGQLDSVDQYLEASLQSCGLEDSYRQQTADVSAIDSKQSAVGTAANNKPWYPKGYKEWDSNMAFKYANNKGGDPCGYSRCTYGKVQVVTRDGCPSGVYAAMNFLNSAGVVEDYSNDTVPYLAPKQKALLTFKSYSSLGSGTIQLVELNCR